jgi:hypothetical protein
MLRLMLQRVLIRAVDMEAVVGHNHISSRVWGGVNAPADNLNIFAGTLAVA